MNLPAPSTETNARRDRQSEAVPQRQRSILLFARIACAIMAASGAALFAVTLPTYIAYLYRPCIPASCIYGQLPVGSDQGLRSLGISLSTYVVLSVTLVTITGLLCMVIAFLLLWRKSDSWIAVLTAFLLAALGITSTIISPPILQPLLGAGAAAFIGNFSNFLGAISLPLLFALFPNGRFVPRWTRWLIIAWLVPAVALTISPFFGTPPALLPILSEILFSVSGLGLIGAQIYRYRRVSTPVERQQTKWVIFGFSLVALIALSLTGPESILSQSGQPYSPYMIIGLLAGSSIGVPIALCFGIAILRSHLYDIDVLINRTLVYGSLTAVLALIYFGSIIGLQALVSTITGHFSIASQSPPVLVASTLVIAALFQPLRYRIQQTIDRRFYRRKYDAARTLAAFSAMLRHEVDLGELHEQLLAVVEETMQPAHISLWLRPLSQDGKQHTNKQ
jgi:hypothetical protein